MVDAQIIYPATFQRAVPGKVEPSTISGLSLSQVAAVKSLRRTAILMRDGDDRAPGFLAILAKATGCHQLADSASRLMEELTIRQATEPPCDAKQGGAA